MIDGLNPVLREAPLLASLLSTPLLGGFKSALEKGRADAGALLQMAESMCRRNARVTALLGEDVCVAPHPHSAFASHASVPACIP